MGIDTPSDEFYTAEIIVFIPQAKLSGIPIL